MGLFSKKDKDEPYLFFELEDENEITANTVSDSNVKPSHVLTPKEVIGSFGDQENVVKSGGALDSLKTRMRNIQSSYNHIEEPVSQPEIKPIENNTSIKVENENTENILDESISLLEKCKPYIVDAENETAVQPAATYKLASVAEILQSESQKTLDRLSEKYDISFDDLGKTTSDKDVVEEPVVIEEIAEPTPEIITVEEPLTNNEDLPKTAFISDIDSFADIKTNANFENTATIKFTPVTDNENIGRISVSSFTRPIDLTGEIIQITPHTTEEEDTTVQLEQTEFEEYEPKEEHHNTQDAKVLNRSLSIKKRSYFLKAAFSVILTIVLSTSKLSFLTGALLGATKVIMIIYALLAGIIIAINADCFSNLPKLFKRGGTADSSLALACVFAMAYSVYGIIKDEIIVDILLILAVSLSARAISLFLKSSYLLSNFRQIAASSDKQAIKLVSDPAVTFAMAKNSIDGDVMIAMPQLTMHIDDYMKYSTYGVFFGGKFVTVTILSFIVSVIVGFAASSYFESALIGLYCAAVIQCLAALPSVFLIDILPNYRAAHRLNRLGAMIAGKTGAEFIEKANAVVLNAEQLFPTGTVTLHQMKVLSDNDIEDTIIRAASLTQCMQSPLAPIFSKIAGTGNITSLPNADTVKYEDRMGISGWVDNRLLFIGNRTLMEAHGIAVPSVEVDRKILRGGYFPVYVASSDKACALLMIQYSVNPQIAHELRKLSSLGVTMLINSPDPNLTEEMICDYLGLYDDTVKVMSGAGVHMFKNSVPNTDAMSAPAAHKGHPFALATIINCANRIKKSNIILTVLYVLAMVLGVVLFVYMSFDSAADLVSGSAILLYSLISTVISYLLYLTKRP